MNMLENAYKLAIKYGITFYEFGPYLSFVNNKIGLCLDIKDRKYGYLTRNYSFDTIDEFEAFIKRYAYYKNTLKGKSDIVINNYQQSNPEIRFGFEIEKEHRNQENITKSNELEKEIDRLETYFKELSQNRATELKKRSELIDLFNTKLLEYKKNLYTYYNQALDSFSAPLDKALPEYKVSISVFEEKIISVRNFLKSTNGYDLKKAEFKSLFKDLMRFELDKRYYSFMYDVRIYQENMSIIEKLNDFIITKLKSKKNRKDIKEDLENIKSENPVSNNKKEFVANEIEKISTKYKDIENITEDNYMNYILKMPLNIKKTTTKTSINKKSIIANLKEQYEALSDDNKNAILMFFSPLKPIISYILKNALNKTLSEADFSYFENIYQEMIEKSKTYDNIVLFQKYFKDIDLITYDSFINSIVVVAKKLYKIKMTLSGRMALWTLEENEEIMSCSQNALKDDESVISCICLEPGSYLIYSPYKIMAKTSDNTLLEYKEVDNFVIIKNYNKMENIGKDEIVTTYKPSTQIETINNHKVKVVKQFNVDKTYHYKYYSCRENN